MIAYCSIQCCEYNRLNKESRKKIMSSSLPFYYSCWKRHPKYLSSLIGVLCIHIENKYSKWILSLSDITLQKRPEENVWLICNTQASLFDLCSFFFFWQVHPRKKIYNHTPCKAGVFLIFSRFVLSSFDLNINGLTAFFILSLIWLVNLMTLPWYPASIFKTCWVIIST